ncbi:MAG: hypothetical protein GY772_02020 [bacterium]|nr:hypothetical protein [bacterium]
MHPKTMDGKRPTCGYISETFRGTKPDDPEDRGATLEHARNALAKCRQLPALAGRGEILDLTAADRRLFDDTIGRMKTTRMFHDETWKELPGYEHKKDPMRPALAGGGGNLPPIAKSQEFLAKSKPMDPDGFFWGRGGHWPLFVQLGLGRDRSALAYSQRDCREAKKAYCRQNGLWPWWWQHPSETGLWCARNSYIVGKQPRGQGYKGVLWRLARAQYTEEEIEIYERPWVEQYGRQALLSALEHSEPFYQRALAENLTVQDIWWNEEHAHFFEPTTH